MLLFGRLTVVLMLLQGLAAVPETVVAQNVGDVAPDFTYTTLAGSELTLSEFRGKVVFVFFFGYSCPLCLAVGNRTETEINAVFSSSDSFQAVGLDLWNGSAVGVNSFKLQTGVTYPLCLKAGDAANLFSTTYDRVMVIDADGIIRYKGTTAVSRTIDAAKSTIETYLATATDVESDAPAQFALHQNYPNPFNPTTTISFTLDSPAEVSLRVYDSLGKEVRTLMERPVAIGTHSVVWDGTDGSGRAVPSGLYHYRLEGQVGYQSRTMLLVQ